MYCTVTLISLEGDELFGVLYRPGLPPVVCIYTIQLALSHTGHITQAGTLNELGFSVLYCLQAGPGWFCEDCQN